MTEHSSGQSSRIPSTHAAAGKRRPYEPSGVMERSYQATEQCISDHPASSVGIAFGVGVGLGICVGVALKSSVYGRRPAHRRMTERLGHQLLEAVSSALPESLAQRMHR